MTLSTPCLQLACSPVNSHFLSMKAELSTRCARPASAVTRKGARCASSAAPSASFRVADVAVEAAESAPGGAAHRQGSMNGAQHDDCAMQAG
jgi:hypothetical protein